jgi:sialic acid synthase SpsE
MLEALRPAPPDAVMPYQLYEVVGKKLTRDLLAGEAVKWTFLAEPGAESGA